MTLPDILVLLDRYEAVLAEIRATQQRRVHLLEDPQLDHLPTMIPTMRDMVQMLETMSLDDDDAIHRYEQLTEKLHRWLGFLQGAMWVKDIYTIEEMRAHNRGQTPPETNTSPPVSTGDVCIFTQDEVDGSWYCTTHGATAMQQDRPTLCPRHPLKRRQQRLKRSRRSKTE